MHRETVRAAIRALGYPDTDAVREVSIQPAQVLVEHIALNDAGAVTLHNGEVVYTITAHPIDDPDTVGATPPDPTGGTP